MHDSKPELKNVEAFKEALSDYDVSDRARQVLQSVTMVALSGLAGGGRNTVISRLVETGNYSFIVSDTTRPPKLRDGEMEQDGVIYHFRSEEDILNDIRNGEFLEAEVIHSQQVSGVSIRELEQLSADGCILIGDFEYGGINNVAIAKPDAFIIALLPPSYDEWVERFSKREKIAHEEFMNRMRTAEKVLQNMLKQSFMKFVVNDDISRCAKTIDEVVRSGAYNQQMHQQGLALAESLLASVKRELGSPQDS